MSMKQYFPRIPSIGLREFGSWCLRQRRREREKGGSDLRRLGGFWRTRGIIRGPSIGGRWRELIRRRCLVFSWICGRERRGLGMGDRLRLWKNLTCVLFSCLEWRNTSRFFKAL